MTTRQPSSPQDALNALHIHCPCCSVQLALSGQPVAQLYCHCDDCRAANGAAYVAAAAYPAEAVTVTRGELRPRVLKTTPRMACSACGSPVFSELPELGVRSVNAFLLPPGVFRPDMHIQCRYAVLPVKDGLPHYKDWPPAYGGSDETVDW